MSKGYDKLKERIGRVEKILGIRHRDPTDPAPKCTCLHLPSGKFQNLWYDPHCPEHGHTKWKKLIKDGVNFKPECTCPIAGTSYYCRKHGVRKFSESLDPEPPLYVRVAKALGNHVMIWDAPKPHWVIDDIVGQRMYPVPRYDLDEKLAIGAFWEYLRQNQLQSIIVRGQSGSKKIVINYQIILRTSDELTAEDYCLAIDKHAEGQ